MPKRKIKKSKKTARYVRGVWVVTFSGDITVHGANSEDEALEVFESDYASNLEDSRFVFGESARRATKEDL